MLPLALTVSRLKAISAIINVKPVSGFIYFSFLVLSLCYLHINIFIYLFNFTRYNKPFYFNFLFFLQRRLCFIREMLMMVFFLFGKC